MRMPDDDVLEQIYSKYPAMTHLDSLGPEAEKQLVKLWRDAVDLGHAEALELLGSAVEALRKTCWD